MPKDQVTLTIRFPNPEELAEWFTAARAVGVIEARAGARHKDALDPGHRAGRGEYIVAADAAVNGWLVEPDRSVPVNPEDPLTHFCECGHQAFWHADTPGQGSGDCEHDGDCPCRAFTPQAREAVSV